MNSIATSVKVWVEDHPFVLEALEVGIINYSALARTIQKELDNAHFESIKKALTRLGEIKQKQRLKREEKVKHLLKNSSFEIKNKVAVIRSNEQLNIEQLAQSKTESGYTTILLEAKIKEISANLRKKTSVSTGHSYISIVSSKQVEETPFVVVYLLSALATEKINVVEIISCREDTVIVIDEIDAPSAFAVLSDIMR